MAHPARVLPSNAPPLRDGTSERRVALQEHSVNQQVFHHHLSQAQPTHLQHQLPSAVTFHDFKPNPVAGVYNENVYAVRPSSTQEVYHAQPQTFYRPIPRAYDWDEQSRMRVEKLWGPLYNRFSQCQRYKEYRAKQSKEDKAGSGQTWPKHLEMAFFKALVYWPPMGRRKHMHKEKQRGRNELIADYIEEVTGISRTRKQVSSHIQVLKPFVEQDEVILRWLSAGKMDCHDDAHTGGPHHSPYTTGRIRSTYAPSHHVQEIRQPSRADIRNARVCLDIFELVEFKLFVQPLAKSRPSAEDIEPLYIYSQSTPQPLGLEHRIDDWQTLKQEYPTLAKWHAMQPIDCNVLAIDASLAMPTRPWRGNNGDCELAVILNCVSRRLLAHRTNIRCINRFYKAGQQLMQADHFGSGEVQLSLADSGDKAETRLKFGSEFWVKVLSPRSSLAASIMSSTKAEPAEKERIWQTVDADMRSITATQEILVPTPTGLEPVLVMHWSFRLSSSEVGSTTWRQVHLPLAGSQKVKAEPKSAVSTESFDFNAPVVGSAAPAVCGASETNYPALQSPFEYDSGSASASATSPATWPTTVSTSSNHSQQTGMTGESMHVDGGFEMSTQGMMVFDNAMDLSNFDATAFDFDVNAAGHFGGMESQGYSQQWSATPYGDSFEGEQWQDFATQPAYQQYNSAQHSNNFEGYEDFQKHANEPGYDAGVAAEHNAENSEQAYAGAVHHVTEENRAWPGVMSDA